MSVLWIVSRRTRNQTRHHLSLLSLSLTQKKGGEKQSNRYPATLFVLPSLCRYEWTTPSSSWWLLWLLSSNPNRWRSGSSTARARAKTPPLQVLPDRISKSNVTISKDALVTVSIPAFGSTFPSIFSSVRFSRAPSRQLGLAPGAFSSCALGSPESPFSHTLWMTQFFPHHLAQSFCSATPSLQTVSAFSVRGCCLMLQREREQPRMAFFRIDARSTPGVPSTWRAFSSKLLMSTPRLQVVLPTSTHGEFRCMTAFHHSSVLRTAVTLDMMQPFGLEASHGHCTIHTKVDFTIMSPGAHRQINCADVGSSRSETCCFAVTSANLSLHSTRAGTAALVSIHQC